VIKRNAVVRSVATRTPTQRALIDTSVAIDELDALAQPTESDSFALGHVADEGDADLDSQLSDAAHRALSALRAVREQRLQSEAQAALDDDTLVGSAEVATVCDNVGPAASAVDELALELQQVTRLIEERERELARLRERRDQLLVAVAQAPT
jgi:hypothetical protein